MDRSIYIPAGATKVSPKAGGVEFHIYENKAGQPCAVCFIGKARKPSWRHRFASSALREQYIKAQIENVAKYNAQKAARRAEQNKPHNWTPGLILSASWGYDQTNVDFYEVVEVIGKTMVRLELIGKQRATDSSDYSHGMAQEIVPDPDRRTGQFFRSKVIDGGAAGKFGYRARPWDGKPAYESWYA